MIAPPDTGRAARCSFTLLRPAAPQ